MTPATFEPRNDARMPIPETPSPHQRTDTEDYRMAKITISEALNLVRVGKTAIYEEAISGVV